MHRRAFGTSLAALVSAASRARAAPPAGRATLLVQTEWAALRRLAARPPSAERSRHVVARIGAWFDFPTRVVAMNVPPPTVTQAAALAYAVEMQLGLSWLATGLELARHPFELRGEVGSNGGVRVEAWVTPPKDVSTDVDFLVRSHPDLRICDVHFDQTSPARTAIRRAEDSIRTLGWLQHLVALDAQIAKLRAQLGGAAPPASPPPPPTPAMLRRWG